MDNLLVGVRKDVWCLELVPEDINNPNSEGLGQAPAMYRRANAGEQRTCGLYGEGFGGEVLVCLMPNDDGEWFGKLADDCCEDGSACRHRPEPTGNVQPSLAPAPTPALHCLVRNCAGVGKCTCTCVPCTLAAKYTAARDCICCAAGHNRVLAAQVAAGFAGAPWCAPCQAGDCMAPAQGTAQPNMLDYLQIELGKLWTHDTYGDTFRANVTPHKDMQHALLHVVKATGKLAAVIDEADHRNAGCAAYPQAEISKLLADLVICACRMANTNPTGQIALGAAVLARIKDKMGATLVPSVAQDCDEHAALTAVGTAPVSGDMWSLRALAAKAAAGGHTIAIWAGTVFSSDIRPTHSGAVYRLVLLHKTLGEIMDGTGVDLVALVTKAMAILLAYEK